MILAAKLFSIAVIALLAGALVLDGGTPAEEDWLRGPLLALIPRMTDQGRGRLSPRAQDPPGWIRTVALAALVMVALGFGVATVLL